MFMRCLFLSLCVAAPARADVAKAVNEVVLPGYERFADAAAELAAKADGTCDIEALRPAWNTAFDAWLQVAHLLLGPGEEEGRSLAIAFWPDPKGLGAKAQAAMLESGDIPGDPAAFAEVSVAARGLFGLERLLYPQDEIFRGAAACALIRATSADLAAMAADVSTGWETGYAGLLLSPGAQGNTVYLSEDEANRALLTALITGLEFIADQRLGRPMGDFDRPRPERAEARASERPLRNVALSLSALRDLAAALVPDAPKTAAGFDRAIALAEGHDDPDFSDVADPQGRLKVEILQQAVRAVQDAVTAELVPAMGVGIGFNAADGD